MADIKPENVKESIEVPTDEAEKYKALGWIEVDTYNIDQKKYIILVWTKDSNPPKP